MAARPAPGGLLPRLLTFVALMLVLLMALGRIGVGAEELIIWAVTLVVGALVMVWQQRGRPS